MVHKFQIVQSSFGNKSQIIEPVKSKIAPNSLNNKVVQQSYIIEYILICSKFCVFKMGIIIVYAFSLRRHGVNFVLKFGSGKYGNVF